MGDKASLNIDLPGVDFAGLAREAIAAKLTNALVGADDAITKIVATAMMMKVDDRGNVNNYSYENKTPYVEWLAQNLIRGAAMQALQARVETLRPAIEGLIEKQLSKNAKTIAITLSDNFIKQAKAGYGVVVNLTATIRTE